MVPVAPAVAADPSVLGVPVPAAGIVGMGCAWSYIIDIYKILASVPHTLSKARATSPCGISAPIRIIRTSVRTHRPAFCSVVVSAVGHERGETGTIQLILPAEAVFMSRFGGCKSVG